MCGLIALINLDGQPVDVPAIERLAQTIEHRGPDDRGVFAEGAVGMAFRRLSILDLAASGHQPMRSAGGEAVIVFNGEIYNYIEIRDELVALGHRFTSSGDTEVLLHAYLEWGPDCVDRLNGMWGFVIYDTRDRSVFVSRDRFGIKPLFVFNGDDCLIVASEVKAITSSGLAGTRDLDEHAISRYLLTGALDVDDRTFFANIRAVQPATSLRIGCDRRVETWGYWKLPTDLDASENSDPANEFAELFEDSVRLRMRSDVPVGVFLSGGLDSTSVICSMARQWQGDKNALSAFCFMDPEFDEQRYIAATLSQTGAACTVLEPNTDRMWSSFEQMLWYQDAPVHSLTALVVFELMQLAAANRIKVILNGEGADESIGGYPSYFVRYWLSLFGRGRWSEALTEVRAYARVHGIPISSILGAQAIRLLRWNAARIPQYRAASDRRNVSRLRNDSWFTSGAVESFEFESPHRAPMSLHQDLAQSVSSEPLPLYLRVVDRNSMAHSIEARLPFMDYRIMEFLFRLPDRWKLRGPWNKYILREGMRNRIPEVVRSRVDKMGFPSPQRRWVSELLYEPIQNLLGGRQIRGRGLYNVDVIRKDLERQRRGEIDVSGRILRVVQTELCLELSGSARPPQIAANGVERRSRHTPS